MANDKIYSKVECIYRKKKRRVYADLPPKKQSEKECAHLEWRFGIWSLCRLLFQHNLNTSRFSMIKKQLNFFQTLKE